MGINNPGIICEHDLFYIFEQFKVQESFFFYKDLINQPEVPRDYQKISDESDKIFYEAFAGDVKLVTSVVNLQKRLMGIEDKDTIKGVEDDIKGSKFNSKAEYERALCRQIENIFDKIARKAAPMTHSDAISILIEAENLREVRNGLIKFV